jgi:hypothetical protein
LSFWYERAEKRDTMTDKKEFTLSDEQMKLVNDLLLKGAHLERQAIINNLEQYKGQQIDVDAIIAALKKVD